MRNDSAHFTHNDGDSADFGQFVFDSKIFQSGADILNDREFVHALFGRGFLRGLLDLTVMALDSDGALDDIGENLLHRIFTRDHIGGFW